MRLFQNSGITAAYASRLATLTRFCRSFAEYRDIFLQDRYGACHFLKPVLDRETSAFFTNGDDAVMQRHWAREQGLPDAVSLEDVLLAQIEHHRSEIFYNIDPVKFPSRFVRRLPGCVRKTVAWRAAPSGESDFSAYDLVVCNFQTLLAGHAANGCKTAFFAPAHDPVMDRYSTNDDRPIDVLFVGGYTRHHKRRAALLEAVARVGSDHVVAMHLERSRLTRLAESPLGRCLPLGRHRRPATIRGVSKAPIFGLDLYSALSRAKIVLNGAIDMAGADRGNMRCFEAFGCRNLLVSDAGGYPDGMVDGETMLCYSSVEEAVSLVRRVLESPAERLAVSRRGHEMVIKVYSKEAQWSRFLALA